MGRPTFKRLPSPVGGPSPVSPRPLLIYGGRQRRVSRAIWLGVVDRGRAGPHLPPFHLLLAPQGPATVLRHPLAGGCWRHPCPPGSDDAMPLDLGPYARQHHESRRRLSWTPWFAARQARHTAAIQSCSLRLESDRGRGKAFKMRLGHRPPLEL